MAWDAVDLRTETGLPVPDADREVILDVAGKAIVRSEQDPTVVIRAAERVGRKLHIIQNLRAYATRAINTALNRAAMNKQSKDVTVVHGNVEALPDLRRRDEIEKRVFVREALEHLDAQDREIFLRHMAGEPCSMIDRDMHLKPRTAETRYRAAKRILRRVLDDKLGPDTGLRGR